MYSLLCHILKLCVSSLFLWEIGGIHLRLSPIRFLSDSGILVGVPVCEISGVAVVARSREEDKQRVRDYRYSVRSRAGIGISWVCDSFLVGGKLRYQQGVNKIVDVIDFQ
jgi:hypothetical protein